jgi:hypothetical protein
MLIVTTIYSMELDTAKKLSAQEPGEALEEAKVSMEDREFLGIYQGMTAGNGPRDWRDKHQVIETDGLENRTEQTFSGPQRWELRPFVLALKEDLGEVAKGTLVAEWQGAPEGMAGIFWLCVHLLWLVRGPIGRRKFVVRSGPRDIKIVKEVRWCLQ